MESKLTKYANDFLKENYDMHLIVPLKINGRLKTTIGRFRYYGGTERKPISVELNKFFVENNDMDIVKNVLKHELVHYALYMQGKPDSDGHPVFENELKKLGVVSQSTIQNYEITYKPKTIVVYTCNDCKYEHKRKRALKNNGRYHYCNCGGSLTESRIKA